MHDSIVVAGDPLNTKWKMNGEKYSKLFIANCRPEFVKLKVV